MSWKDRFLSSYTVVSEEQAARLQTPDRTCYTVGVRPPPSSDGPGTLDDFVQSILEIQTRWFGLRNTSPIIAFEVVRPVSESLRFQFVVPTKRLERKVRTQLSDEIPDVGFDSGLGGLPISEGDSIGGGLLTAGEEDWYPFRTDFSSPPTNALAALLHRHAIRDTNVVAQVLFQPLSSRSLRNRLWRRRAVKQRDYLRREKEKIWGSRSPTRREKRQADAVDTKIGTSRFWVCIRFLVVGAGEFTLSRVKELAGGFNRFENPETGQYFNMVVLRRLRRPLFVDFGRAVVDRRFGGWSRRFRCSAAELAGMISVPDRSQRNIQTGKP